MLCSEDAAQGVLGKEKADLLPLRPVLARPPLGTSGEHVSIPSSTTEGCLLARDTA